MAIKIDPANKGKFTATKKKSGKTTAELKKSNNPLTKKRAVFAANAKKWAKNRKKNLSSILDDIIEFRSNGQSSNGSNGQAPKLPSAWHPIQRHRQIKALKEWVAKRPPSAGITGEQLEKQYPGHPGRTRHVTGAITGGVLGAAAGGIGAAALTRGRRGSESAIRIGASLGGTIGGSAGFFASDPKHFLKQHREHKADWGALQSSFKNNSVEASGVKAAAPVATSHREVAGELKKQGVGFFKRHAAGLATFPIRHSTNAAFIPEGNKGVIVSGKKVPEIFIRHESGHAKDYAHYGGKEGFGLAYPNYGKFSIRKKPYIHNTLLPEHRAWAHAGKLSKEDTKTKDAALRTYARGGMLLSERLDNLISFRVVDALEFASKKPIGIKETLKHLAGKNKSMGAGKVVKRKPGMKKCLSEVLDDILNFDQRPRNQLGEFSGQQEGVADPNSMAKVYNSQVTKDVVSGAAGAVGGGAAVGAGNAVKNLYGKLKAAKIRK